MEVGGAYVRLRPTISDEDAATLAATRELATDIAAAFEKFFAALGDEADMVAAHLAPVLAQLPKGDT